MNSGLRGILRWLRWLPIWVLVGGCATTPSFTTGIPPKVEALERLQKGSSTPAEIVRALGQPMGTGATLMPVGRADLWFYAYTEVEGNKTRINYLLIYLVEDRYDGYLWFDATSKVARREK